MYVQRLTTRLSFDAYTSSARVGFTSFLDGRERETQLTLSLSFSRSLPSRGMCIESLHVSAACEEFINSRGAVFSHECLGER